MKGKLSMFLMFHTILLATSYPQGNATKVSSITINLKPSLQPKTQRQESFEGLYRATKVHITSVAQRGNDGNAESNGGAYAGVKGGRGSAELSYGGNRPHSGIGGSGSIRGNGGRFAGMEGGHGAIDISYEGNERDRWNAHHRSNEGYGNSGVHGCKGTYASKRVYGCNGGHGNNGAYGGSDEYKGSGDHTNNGSYGGGAVEGCKDESGRLLKFGETYRKGNFIFKCERLSSMAVSLTPIKCILDGQDMRIGEKRRRDGFLYACLKTETGITMDLVGCFGDDDTLAEFGETFTVKNFIFMCTKEGNAGIHKPYGCLIENKQVKMGQTVHVRSFLYKCSLTRDGSVQTEVVACVDKSGKQIDIGGRYRDGPFLYQCKKTESGVRAALVGCVAEVSGFDQEFTFGESWNTNAKSPLSYKMKCVGDESRATIDITHCVANLEHAKTATPVGSHVELAKNMVLVCRRQADGQVLNRVVSCEEFERNERQFFCRNVRS